MTFPFCNQRDIHTAGVRLLREKRHFDAEGYERTERLNGAYQCPKCELWWPVIESPDCWTVSAPGQRKALEWFGFAACSDCELLMVDQPDGRSERYDLSGSK